MSGKRHPEEFKIEAVKQVTERGYKVGEVARRLGVTTKSMNDWIKRYGDESAQYQTITSQQDELRRLEAGLWILNTGVRWHMLLPCDPNYKTVHRRFQNWYRIDVLREVMTELANTLRDEGALDESECLLDATFSSAKGGGNEISSTKRGKDFEYQGNYRPPQFACGSQYACREPP